MPLGGQRPSTAAAIYGLRPDVGTGNYQVIVEYATPAIQSLQFGHDPGTLVFGRGLLCRCDRFTTGCEPREHSAMLVDCLEGWIGEKLYFERAKAQDKYSFPCPRDMEWLRVACRRPVA